jgi:hypothetical protein
VLGLGRGGQGWAEVRDDAAGGYASMRWLNLGWPGYDDEVGDVHPAVGDIDSDAAAEIVLGLGEYPGYGGWFQIRDDATTGYASLGWKRVNWEEAETQGIGTFPAVGRLR